LHILSEGQGLSEERKGTKRHNEYHRKQWVQGEKVYILLLYKLTQKKCSNTEKLNTIQVAAVLWNHLLVMEWI
jgi:hypothetical protein